MTVKQQAELHTNGSDFARAALGGLIVLWIACAPSIQPEPDLAVVLERHAEARGGRTALESLHSMEVELEITEPEFTVSGRYVATRDGWMRIDIHAGGERVFTEALGPDGGWQMHADGIPLDLSADGERALVRGIHGNLYGLHELADIGFEQTLVGRSERDGKSVWEIEQTAPDGFSQRIFLDAETYLVSSAVETAALHPDIDSSETRQETFYREYRPAGELLFPARMEKIDRQTEERIQTTLVQAVRVNVPVDRKRFERPAEAEPS